MYSGICPVNTVLIDLSGTIHIDDTEVPGSVKALARLRDSKVNIKFVTNTTKESKKILLERLLSIGFTITEEEIFTSLTAARNLIDQRKVRPLLMVDDNALEDFAGVPTENPNSVVVGLAPEKFDYNTMNHAFRLVLSGAPLIAIHKAQYYKRKDGLALGPGPFVTALEFSTDQKAEVVGKPEAVFFLSAVEEFNVMPSQCIMIGDDVRDDIGGAQNTGMKGVLVKTGKYRNGDESKIHPPPYFMASNFAEAVDFILTSFITT